ncbi:MAG: RdgB/HAM1 family non-canonical purine NTP pyrophosphatase [Candidatus Omnitrophica bacterium]|nr:RdgB/HAM1 family non-canonical purine NTP pyrophosphatase [Candidatus Omnitrophota bacterium]
MLDLVIATRNRHKAKELAGLLSVRGIRWHSLAEFPEAPLVKETGRTFGANAIKKAQAMARATGLLTLADDSGLEVDALGGRPGVRSARFAGRQVSAQDNNEKLLRMLDGLAPEKRSARYRCSLALAGPSGVIAFTQGTWRGRIAERPQGHLGFGYDPIFFVPRFGKTVGQLPASTKQRFSHRAIAARQMRAMLKRLVATGRVSRRCPATVGSGRRGPGLIV